MVDQLAGEYADRNVLFVEQDVDASLGEREMRWWLGYGAGCNVYLPLVMTDSGHQVSNGSEDFHAVYSAMVDSALQRPPAAHMTVASDRDGNVLRFDVELTNSSGVTLSSANSATVTALVYEDSSKSTTGRLVVAAVTAPIFDLADGATGDLTLAVLVTGATWDRVRWVVIADYQPEGVGHPFDTLQAVMGE